ncbi:putative quinol monooxygenase [Carnobacterium sp. ISL-102]|uniref:putative quinol monooxygenase n=1 Tax=Carnobacterium sp. ISL-102 TaxID=2819142 RepID=UPI001BE66077|nr:putative quinol monooxygenase [Carnobacterium sp. ISL-102]MBT2732032.1 antibiotic biosynthesis monooxygenase [Carnobacterium sp. ISL-102]
MKVINASFFIKEDQRENFLSDTKELISATRKEEGCLAYNLYESLEERNAFIMVELWKDQAAINNHNQSSLLQSLFSKIADFSTKAPELKISELSE